MKALLIEGIEVKKSIVVGARFWEVTATADGVEMLLKVLAAGRLGVDVGMHCFGAAVV